MSTRQRPVMPTRLDDRLYEAMLDAVGESLAFRAVDACWASILREFTLVTRATPEGLVEVLELEVAS